MIVLKLTIHDSVTASSISGRNSLRHPDALSPYRPWRCSHQRIYMPLGLITISDCKSLRPEPELYTSQIGFDRLSGSVPQHYPAGPITAQERKEYSHFLPIRSKEAFAPQPITDIVIKPYTLSNRRQQLSLLADILPDWLSLSGVQGWRKWNLATFTASGHWLHEGRSPSGTQEIGLPIITLFQEIQFSSQAKRERKNTERDTWALHVE